MSDVTICIPTIHGREKDLVRCLRSIRRQDYINESAVGDAVDTAIYQDHNYQGPAFARNFMVKRADSDFIAFLDDDDYLLNNHLSVLIEAQRETDADIVWPWFRVEGGTDPFPQNRGKQWDRENPHLFPVTVLIRKEAFLDVGGFDYGVEIEDPNEPGSGRMVNGEDWRLWLRLSEAGAKFHHIDEVTWVWRHHGNNTSGRPDLARRLHR